MEWEALVGFGGSNCLLGFAGLVGCLNPVNVLGWLNE